MRITRIVASSATAALVGTTLMAVSAPAQAADNWTTTTVATPDETEIEYGDEIYVDVEVHGSDGLSPSSGTSTLYAMEAGSSTWVPVTTGAYPGSDFYPVKPQKNTVYKVVFGGWTEPVQTDYSDNYAGSESAPFAISVKRGLTIKNPRGTLIKGKVKPDYKKKPIIIKKKVGKKWKKFRKIKTDKRSRFQITLPAPRRGKWKWAMIVPGDDEFATAISGGSTYSLRTAAPRVSVNP